ncbi:MAG TPA: DUF4405 domain-containing protein [Nitrospirales bacterium]|nr:DUF4405 domain-containing protein [Nitrospirales bacterium]
MSPRRLTADRYVRFIFAIERTQLVTSFASRRWRNLVICGALSILIVGIHFAYSVTLYRTVFFSGWLLFFVLLALASYNVRKKLPFLPLGTSSSWLQFHIYMGYLTLVLFAIHIGLHVPNGWIEGTLALLYVVVAGSGITGIGLTRWYSRRLAMRGREVIFERIPAMRKHLREDVEDLLVRSAAEMGSTTIADFSSRRVLTNQVIPFLEGPKNFFWHLIGSHRPRDELLTKLQSQDRYFNEREREIAQEIGTLILAKDDLDYHNAHQLVLKYWLFIHIPLSYSLLILSLIHGALASAYRESSS